MRNPVSLAYQSVNQTWGPGPKWSVDDIPDLTGKVAIVTGGNAGIGYETAKQALNHGAKVYITARDKTKATSTVEKLKTDTGKNASYLIMDLTRLSSVKAAAEEFLAKENHLNILWNNAGVMRPPLDQITPDGFDLQFGTNVLGPFYFTKLLLPTILATAKETGTKSRIITTASFLHEMVIGQPDFAAFKDGPVRNKCTPDALYCRSKYCNILVSNEYARRFGDNGVVAISLHPGIIQTELWTHFPGVMRSFVNVFLQPSTMGALTQLRAGTDPEADNWNGKYMIPWARVGAAQPSTNDQTVSGKLWDYLEEQLKILT